MEHTNEFIDWKLTCELCEVRPYDTTDKGTGEILLVCFDCKRMLLVERNKDNVFDLTVDDADSEEIERGIEDALERDTPYIQEMADRFGVGGRY